MKTLYSITQATNITALAGAIYQIIQIIGDTATLTELQPEQISIGLAALGIIIAAVASYIDRFKKGDLEITGMRKAVEN